MEKWANEFKDLTNKYVRIEQCERVRLNDESTNYELKLQKLKEKTHSVMSGLADYDINKWSKHTKTYDVTAYLPSFFQSKYNAELCTRAWVKFYDILNKIWDQVVVRVHGIVQPFKTLHLCEGPGAFVTSLNHFLASTDPAVFERWTWTAITLNPYFEANDPQAMISDTSCIDSCYRNWYFCKDYSGDILRKENFIELINKHQRKKFSLVTADGSIDCSGDFSQQEEMTINLIITEALLGLYSLEGNGTLVLKMFTTYNKFTVSFLYFIQYHFKSFIMYKPCASGQGNNERYMVFRHFISSRLGYLFDVREIMSGMPQENKFVDFTSVSFIEPPQWFFESIYNSADFFAYIQTESIQKNIFLFENPPKGRGTERLKKRFAMANYFKNTLNVLPLEEKNKLIYPSYDVTPGYALKNVLGDDLYNFIYKLDKMPSDNKVIRRVLLSRIVFCRNYSNIKVSLISNLETIKKIEHLASKAGLHLSIVAFHENIFGVLKHLDIDVKNVYSFISDTELIPVIAIALSSTFPEISNNIDSNLPQQPQIFDFGIVYDFILSCKIDFSLRERFLCRIFAAYNKLHKGGTLLLGLGEYLSNFVIDITVLQALFFDEVFFIRPKQTLYTGMFLCCKGFKKIFDDFDYSFEQKKASDLILHHFVEINSGYRKEIVKQLYKLNALYYKNFSVS